MQTLLRAWRLAPHLFECSCLRQVRSGELVLVSGDKIKSTVSLGGLSTDQQRYFVPLLYSTVQYSVYSIYNIYTVQYSQRSD